MRLDGSLLSDRYIHRADRHMMGSHQRRVGDGDRGRAPQRIERAHPIGMLLRTAVVYLKGAKTVVCPECLPWAGSGSIAGCSSPSSIWSSFPC